MAPTLHERTRMLSRKQFLHRALGACAGALGLTLLHACSDGTTSSTGSTGGTTGGGGGVDASPVPTARCVQNGTVSTIRTNHGHVLVVSKQDVIGRAQKVYDIRGSADHTHAVTINQDQMGQLAINNAIMTVSTLDVSGEFGAHQHDIMVACL